MTASGDSCFTLSAAIKASSADTVTLCVSPAIFIPTVNSSVISASSCRLPAVGLWACSMRHAKQNSGDTRFRVCHFARRDLIPISLRPESVVQDLLDRPWAGLGKSRARQPRLRDGLQRRVAVGGGEGLGQEGFQARVVVEMVSEAVALDADARFPTRAALLRLVSPFEQVKQEDAQAADELALLRPAHAFDFLGDVLDVGVGEPAGA